MARAVLWMVWTGMQRVDEIPSFQWIWSYGRIKEEGEHLPADDQVEGLNGTMLRNILQALQRRVDYICRD